MKTMKPYPIVANTAVDPMYPEHSIETVQLSPELKKQLRELESIRKDMIKKKTYKDDEDYLEKLRTFRYLVALNAEKQSKSYGIDPKIFDLDDYVSDRAFNAIVSRFI